MMTVIKKYILIFVLMFCIFGGANAKDRFFTYYNTWCMASDNQWNLNSSAYFLSVKSYITQLGKTTHVIIFNVNDIVVGDHEPYFSITNEYIANGGSKNDSLNFWYDGYNNPRAGYSSWVSDGTVFELRDSLHARGKYILACLQAVNTTGGLNAVVTDSVKTEKFTTAVAKWVYRHNFDGVDLNAEAGKSYSSSQLARFFRKLREKMPDKLITAVPLVTDQDYFKLSIQYMDFIIPQMYAYTANWQTVPTCSGAAANGVFLKAPLHRDPQPPNSNHQDITTWGPLQWVSAGWPKDKIVLLLSNEANPIRGVDTLFGCVGWSLPFWPDTAAYAMLSRGGTLVWDNVHIGHYIKGTATQSFTSNGTTISSGQKFIIPFLSDRNIDSVVAWGKRNGFTNYGLYDVSTDARTKDVVKTPRHAHFMSLLDIDEVTSIPEDKERGEVLGEYTLKQNFPNPFNPVTTVEFSLPQNSYVVIKLYDVIGREVATVIDQQMEAGNHSSIIDASHLTSGVYFYRMVADKFSATKKLLLMR